MAVSYSNAADNFKVEKSSTKCLYRIHENGAQNSDNPKYNEQSCLRVNEGGTYQNCYTETCNPACTDMLA